MKNLSQFNFTFFLIIKIKGTFKKHSNFENYFSGFEFSSNQLNKKCFTFSQVFFLFNIEKLQWEFLVHLNIHLVIELTPSIFSKRNLCGRGHSLIDQDHTNM